MNDRFKCLDTVIEAFLASDAVVWLVEIVTRKLQIRWMFMTIQHPIIRFSHHGVIFVVNTLPTIVEITQKYIEIHDDLAVIHGSWCLLTS